jgi:hypothetical protein
MLDLKDEALTAENEDLLEMTELHEATLLKCVENRYRKDVIYVCVVNSCNSVYVTNECLHRLLLVH